MAKLGGKENKTDIEIKCWAAMKNMWQHDVVKVILNSIHWVFDIFSQILIKNTGDKQETINNVQVGVFRE